MQNAATRLGQSLVFVIVLTLGGHSLVYSQSVKDGATTKFDEFGEIEDEDQLARLDFLSIQVNKQPGAKAYVVCYGPQQAGERVLKLIKDYLVNSRGLAPAAVSTIYGGRNSSQNKIKIELWTGSKAGPPSPLQTHTGNPGSFQGIFIDKKASDDVLADVPGEFDGSVLEGFTYAALAETLQYQSKANFYIVGYNGADAMPGAWRRVAQRQLEKLKRYKLDADRFKTIFGGVQEETRVQVWVWPNSAPLPLKDGGPEPTPGKTIELASFNDHTLGQTAVARATFKRLVDVLTTSPNLRACVIVRHETGKTPGTDRSEDSTAADLSKLVESWRDELERIHSIREDRFIVLHGTSTSDEGNSLDAWLVPAGQVLPNANSPKGEEFKKNDPQQAFLTALRSSSVALKFDEYGSLRSCDHSARLDNFAIQLQNLAGSRGFLVIYAPQSGVQKISEVITYYLVNTRGLAPETFQTIHGGLNDVPSAPRVQLWIGPPGAAAPEPKRFETKIEAFKGMFGEDGYWDHVQLETIWDVDGEMAYGVPSVSRDAFTEILESQKDSIAYVVAYSGADSLPGAWRRAAESTVDALKGSALESSRFKIIYGGTLKDPKIQTWILPKADPPPVEAAAAEPSLNKAVQLGDFGEYELGSTKNEEAVLARIVEVLGSDSKLRACVIVRLPTEDPDEEPELEPVEMVPDIPTDDSEPAEPEPEPADLLKLVEKWKKQLSEKHKLREDRFVVLFSTADEYTAGSLETWIVPAGQPLPDPNKKKEDH